MLDRAILRAVLLSDLAAHRISIAKYVMQHIRAQR